MTTPEVEASDVAALRRHVGADATHDDTLADCWAEAVELVAAHVTTAQVPAAILRRARLEVGSELYHRRNAPGGVMAQFTDLGAAPVRMARDPMLGAYPLLRPYLPGGFG